MIRKHLAATGGLLALVLWLPVGAAQGGNPAASQSKPATGLSKPATGLNKPSPAAYQNKPSSANPPAASPGAPAPSVPASPGAAEPGTGSSASSPDNCPGGGPCDATPSHITIATPAPAPAPWPWQDRIRWVAEIVGVIILYFGVMLAVSTLRKIERQTRYTEAAAQAAADSAKALLVFAQSQADADRPWVLVSPETVPGAPDKFTIVATNRGRSPARIVSLVDEIASAGDDSKLPPAPVYKNEPQPPPVSDILLPGESIGIKSFSRDEVSSVCETPEQLQLVESWIEKIYLYGNLTYQDLRASDGTGMHQTSWCCWYIHGRQKSGLVMAGPPTYNRHS